MSHSSGISASKELINTFGDANHNTVRFVKVSIVNEELVATKVVNATGTFEQDLDTIPTLLEKDHPCYILAKTDEKSIELSGNQWVFMFYVPDIAKVKEKMTYASTRANLKKELGSSHFVDEVYSSAQNDFTKRGYQAHRTHQESSAPLTLEEQQKADEREGGLFVGGGGMYVHGVSFPVEDRAMSAINDFLASKANYVQLAINIADEKIVHSTSGNVDADDLSSKVPGDEPRFHFFRYTHNHEGEQLDSIIFVFSCPDGSAGTKSAPVRQRMLYSSSKANVESLVTKHSVKVDLKLEINNGTELTKSIIDNELHPQKAEEKKAFSKPTRPGAGARKLINPDIFNNGAFPITANMQFGHVPSIM
ncbi:hypothetical protein SAMD00019534_091500 [Acytostelium subglobosum LB1]|uniref:hypothetical protein n=1 Tax=Acytostelium subglobosum LB1 TaxID=1410327 RepID=UPI00064502CB|nr:hypothetical protein SAMD00019534_091500 [Acytostelium subglobosum LB1]GAM25975.1 hypothetical protein SAMD00019534_091500 [Acytostelium subglobosum LB1]|eukprot:XP_012751018.1 hypothetical protein SAMD00019534_091500 [Acytostelium subglobosum LB1]